MQETTKMEDRYGLPMTTSSISATNYLVEGLDLALEQNFAPEREFQQAVEADEGFALAYVGLAYSHMVGARLVDARKSIQSAKSLASGTTRREQQQIEIIDRWINGKGSESLALIREHLAEFPRDMLVVRVAQRLYILGCSSVGAGVANYPQELFALMKSVAAEYGDDWAFQGQYSFAHHENGLLDEALQMAERSLGQRPTNAVASHSIAHVYFERGDALAGNEFLASWLPGFDDRASYHVHLRWHLALFQLAMGHYQKALEVYNTGIRPSVVAKSAISLTDSASLMWRLQIYGAAAPPDLMSELSIQAAPAAEQPGPAFRDSHAALAFGVASDEQSMARMMDGLQTAASNGDKLVKEVTLPLVEGIFAFVHQDYGETIRLMEPLFNLNARYDQLARVGGSHAQREVFEDTLTEAYLRSGQSDKAEAMIGHRLRRRESPRDLFWLARAQEAEGNKGAASSNLRQAENTWIDADSDSKETAALVKLAEKVR